jgi:predicted metal-dependent peptidase
LAETLNLSTEDHIFQAKVWLVLHQPFFSHLVLEQHYVPDPEGVPTLSTDGKAVYYNPEFVSGLSVEILAGAICHELMHNLLFHLSRRRNRIAELWNLATDIAVNNDLIETGLRLPEGSIRHPEFKGMNAERIYAILHEEYTSAASNQTGTGDKGKGEDTMTRFLAGYGVKKEDLLNTHDRWKDACGDDTDNIWISKLFKGLAAAGKADYGGGVPGNCVRMVQALISPKVSWKEKLAHVLSFYLKPHDFDAGRPNLKYLSQGLYLPALKLEIPHQVIAALDTSASICRETLRSFWGELLELMQEVDNVKAVAFDTVVYEFDALSGQAADHGFSGPVMKGGGGTDFRPVFRYIEEDCIFPDILLIFTDLNGRFPDFPPSYPVLWIATQEVVKSPPFGEVLFIPQKEMVL